MPTIAQLLSLLLSTCFTSLATAAPLGDPFEWTFDELSPDVWAGVREDAGRTPVMGATMFVVTDVGVVVFDGGGVPLMSERLVAKIQEVTDLPVTHIVISHWHGDHCFGIARIRDVYPQVEIVAHAFTRAAMTGSRITYIHRRPQVVGSLRGIYLDMVEKRVDEEGVEIPPHALARAQEFLDDADVIDAEYNRLELVLPTVSFREALTIHSGERDIELLFLGDGNTAGDVVMWLPEERIVATGDLVVHPTPYGFNVPPSRWADTLRRLQDLEYRTLVPGHGDIQRDTSYVDLLIEVCDSVVEQRDRMVAEGVPSDEIGAKLDVSGFEERFTGGDPGHADLFESYFTAPMRRAALKELSGIPMVDVK